MTQEYNALQLLAQTKSLEEKDRLDILALAQEARILSLEQRICIRMVKNKWDCYPRIDNIE